MAGGPDRLSNTAGCVCERRRRYKTATTAMQITAIPPTTPPTMAPVFGLLPPEDACDSVINGDVAVPVGAIVEPGPTSGESIAKRGVRS